MRSEIMLSALGQWTQLATIPKNLLSNIQHIPRALDSARKSIRLSSLPLSPPAHAEADIKCKSVEIWSNEILYATEDETTIDYSMNDWSGDHHKILKPNLLPMNGSDSNSFPLEARKNKGTILENMAPLFSEPRVRASREKIISNPTAFIGSKLGLNIDWFKEKMLYPHEAIGKKERRQMNIERLKMLKIPYEQDLPDLLKAVSKLQKKLKNSPSTLPFRVPATIHQENCFLQAYNHGQDIFLFFPHSTDPNKFIEKGTFKKAHFAWLLTKKPKRVACLISKLTNTTRRKMAENEIKYLDKYRNDGVFPRLFKCAYFKSNSLSMNESDSNEQVLLLKYYPIDLMSLISFWKTSKEKISKKRKMKIAINIMKHIAYLHRKRIVHRDLKPENVLLQTLNKLKLCDLGMACKAAKVHGGLKGTIEFLSPEMFDNDFKIDEMTAYAIDIWAAGCMLHELFLQPVPWYAVLKQYCSTNNPEEKKTLMNKMKETVQTFHEEQPQEGGISFLLWEMLHPDPAARPSAADVMKTLRECL